MNKALSNSKLWETRKLLLRAWTTVGTHLTPGNKPRTAGAPQHSLFAEDALWAFEWRNPVFTAEFRKLLNLIPMRDGTFMFKYGFVCQTIVGWNGKVPNAGEMKVEELLHDITQLIKQHAHAASEFRTLLLDYRHVGYSNLCRMIVNQGNNSGEMKTPRSA